MVAVAVVGDLVGDIEGDFVGDAVGASVGGSVGDEVVELDACVVVVLAFLKHPLQSVSMYLPQWSSWSSHQLN